VWRRVAGALAPLILVSAAWALDETKDKPKSDPPDKAKSAAEQLRDLRQEVQKARDEILAKYREAKDDEAKQELAQQYNGVGASFAGRYLELAQKHPKDPAALDALVAVLTEADGSPQAATAAELIVKDHLGAKRVLDLVPQLGRSPAAAAETVLRAIVTKAEDKADRGKATMALAESLKERAGTVRVVKDAAPDLLKRIKSRLGEDGLKRLQEADPARLEGEAEKLFEKVSEEYADVKLPRGTSTLGDRAKAELFELRNLAIGKTAPEIEAEDIDGTKFKLSDYRGKVILLDFWGHW
jgi:hypothetical protein